MVQPVFQNMKLPLMASRGRGRPPGCHLLVVWDACDSTTALGPIKASSKEIEKVLAVTLMS